MRKTLLITNSHEDYTGGGSYVMMILNVLKKYYDVYTDKNPQYYTHDRTPFRMNVSEISLAKSDQTFDLHLLADYHGWTQPRGKVNAQIMYYPLPKTMRGWNKQLLLNEFCFDVAKNLYTNFDGHIISPYLNADDFYISEKTNSLINVGQYFIEPDGHSKNQKALIEWFKTQPQFDKMTFHGKATHPRFYNQLVNLAKDDPRIEVKCDRPSNEIRKDYSEAKYMIHAIGLGRTDPAQTEHFGIVALEALLSGCQPIVHNSGGCKFISGVRTYDQLSDITFPEFDPNALRQLGSTYSIHNTEKQLMKALS